MKRIGLLTTAILFSTVLIAQTSGKNEHGVSVRSDARSETTIGKNKGEDVSATASMKSQSSISAAKPHTSDKAEERRERKEAAAAKKAELKTEVATKKEAAISRKEEARETAREVNEAALERKAEVKARTEARADATVDQVSDVKSEVGASVRKARSTKAQGSANSKTKVQLRRPSVSGKIGANTRLHL